MKRLVQKINYTISYEYDGSGFEELDGIKRFDSHSTPYIHYKFVITDSGFAYFIDEENFSNPDDIVLNTIDVKIYSDKISITHPYIPTESWAKTANINIINSLENKFDSFNCNTQEYTVSDDFYIGCPHPHLNPEDVLYIFNDESLYNFSLEKFTKEELENINIYENIEQMYVLRDALQNNTHIYYYPENNSFYFKNTELLEEFNKMIFNLLHNNSPSEFIPKSCPELIDTGVLVLWVYWHGRPAIHFWDYIKEYLYLNREELYSRRNAFNYVRSKIPYKLTSLQLRRIESDLVELLSYEYPIKDINRNEMMTYFESRCNKNIDKIFWDIGLKYNINSYVNISAPQDAFDYPQDIGFKGDIIYYESDKLPVKIALQLKIYDSVIPIENSIMDIDKHINTTPFAWYGKIIGFKKLDNDVTEEEVKNVFNIDSLFLLYNSIFDKASQLRLKDLDTQLDIILNKPDTTAWD